MLTSPTKQTSLYADVRTLLYILFMYCSLLIYLGILESCPTSLLQSLCMYSMFPSKCVADQIVLQSSVECNQMWGFTAELHAPWVLGESIHTNTFTSFLAPVHSLWLDSVFTDVQEAYQKSLIAESEHLLSKFLWKNREVLLWCIIMMHDLAWCCCCCVIVVIAMENSTMEDCWH